MNRHVLAERRHLLRKTSLRLRTKSLDPERKRLARRLVKPFPLLRLELVRKRNRREPGRMQNLIGISIADPAQHARIGERPLERAILRSKRGAEGFKIARKHIDPSRIDRIQPVFSAKDMQRRTPLASRFGKHQRAAGKIAT